MRIRLLATGSSESPSLHYVHTFVVDGRVAVDAGALGLDGTPERQARVTDVLLSHSHSDHVSSLPVFLENVRGLGRPVRVHAGPDVIASLRSDVFNNRVWPDERTLHGEGQRGFELMPLEPERPLELDGLRILPVALDHTVPTLGFLIESATRAAAIVCDTAPTARIWELARALPRLDAVFLEASFPDAQAELARASRHLTPALFAREAAKLGRPTRWIAVHVKARWHAETVAELERLDLPGFEAGVPGREYVL